MPIKVKIPNKDQVIDAEFTVLTTEPVKTSESFTPPIEINHQEVPTEAFEQSAVFRGERSALATARRVCRVCGGSKKLKRMSVLMWDVDVCKSCIDLGTNAASLLELILG